MLFGNGLSLLDMAWPYGPACYWRWPGLYGPRFAKMARPLWPCVSLPELGIDLDGRALLLMAGIVIPLCSWLGLEVYCLISHLVVVIAQLGGGLWTG